MKIYSWHDDGHVIQLSLDQGSVGVTGVICPNRGECAHAETRCIVDYFIMNYGLECNVGSCEMARDIQIAWTVENGSGSLDALQVWITPVDDIAFAGFREAAISSS